MEDEGLATQVLGGADFGLSLTDLVLLSIHFPSVSIHQKGATSMPRRRLSEIKPEKQLAQVRIT